MKYIIKAQSRRRIRICIKRSGLTKNEADILQYAFSHMPGVKKVTIYQATGGCAIEFDCRAEAILERLDRFRFENVDMLVREEEECISVEELKNRKLDQDLKRKLRLRIAAETVSDVIMPMPVQVAYHLWQFISLKNL